jgi:hypothetical protein
MRATERKRSPQPKDHAKLRRTSSQHAYGWCYTQNIAAFVFCELTATHFIGLGQARSCHQNVSIRLHINDVLCGAALVG